MVTLVRLLTGLVFFASAASASTITFTCDPNVDATAAGTCSYLNTQIAHLYTSSFSNVSASIFIEQGITGLATSEAADNFIPFSTYVNTLTSAPHGDAIDTAALAALNTLDAAVYGSDNVVITSALASALGFTAVGGLTAAGANCTIGVAGCYNGIIIVTTLANLAAAHPGESLYYRQNGGSITSGAFDYYSLVERETDKILGTASCISTTAVLSDYCDNGTGAAAGTGTPSAADLFRYNGVGNLALNNASLGLGAAPAGAYFSNDGGVTNAAAGAVFNTVANNQDYADFTASCTWVQTAPGCKGQSLDITTDGDGEINMLDAVGYTPVAEPGTLVLVCAGLMAVGLRRYFRCI